PLILMEMVLGQRDRAESAGIRLEREVGHAVDERKLVAFVLDAGAEMHAELHGSASRPFPWSNGGHPRRPPPVTPRRGGFYRIELLSARGPSCLAFRILQLAWS